MCIYLYIFVSFTHHQTYCHHQQTSKYFIMQISKAKHTYINTVVRCVNWPDWTGMPFLFAPWNPASNGVELLQHTAARTLERSNLKSWWADVPWWEFRNYLHLKIPWEYQLQWLWSVSLQRQLSKHFDYNTNVPSAVELQENATPSTRRSESIKPNLNENDCCIPRHEHPNCNMLLMNNILQHLEWQKSQYLLSFYIPIGAGSRLSTVCLCISFNCSMMFNVWLGFFFQFAERYHLISFILEEDPMPKMPSNRCFGA